ncbi:hypothetical protein P152DRAFT_470782 [Eremomyces bilateralis CBS 781.70]|uniref:Amino acid transporter transmembrane domain-containing protein n=1 Tax=Eremomyces bilateralis CBS 781.70 TaxID=1392243 RepID=A0A6G1GB86_9PEZI|nr:uncharacterized protein P152DRAFT_470782 [Eremomyces bilateralis CBS 781.70]KAF1815335.1 hypothetical protein P152DRAFT_470782 [Eremomyces bilateralis CBS 781.70]
MARRQNGGLLLLHHPEREHTSLAAVTIMFSSPHRGRSPELRPLPESSSTPHTGSVRAASPPESARSGTPQVGSPAPYAPGSPSIRQIPALTQSNAAENSQSNIPLPGLDSTKSPPGSVPGESALAAAFKSASKESPPRFGTPPPIRALSPVPLNGDSRVPRSNYGSFDGRSSPAPFEDPEVIRRHLVTASGRNSVSNFATNSAEGSSSHRGREGSADLGTDTSTGPALDRDEFSSLQLQGGDVTRQIYRWSEQQEHQGSTKRSRSFHEPRPRPDEQILDIGTIKQPGGFRRNHLRRQAVSPSPERSIIGPDGSVVTEQRRPRPQVFTDNFIEFLSLYGHFAGEELEEEEDESDAYFTSETYEDEYEEGEEEPREYGEDSALLTPGRRKKRKEKPEHGGSPSTAALLLLKSFVGTGVLFLPRAFLNGGMLFSSLVLLVVSALSYYCFLLLVGTRLAVPASYGGMGEKLFGKWMKTIINFSLIISQLGFSSAYIVFTSENLQAFILAVSKCKTRIDIKFMILMQMIIFLPLSLYRNINNIQKLALVADLFIMLGLIYLYYYDVITLVGQGGISDVKLLNPRDWTLFIGTAIFTFEGIGLIIPIQESMRQPKKFPPVLGGVMVIITVIFTSMGALSYAAYGSKTQTVVILNLPQDDKLVNGVQFIYSLAILLSTPLQFFPAIEITSKYIFPKTARGKYNPRIKWKKNVFRFCMVVLCAMIAWVGANDLDKFVALVGSFACIPLVYIYPPMLHYRGVATKTWQRGIDIFLIVFGGAVMVYTTVLTAKSWVSGNTEKQPGYCDQL